MGLRYNVVSTIYSQLTPPVCWKTHEERILDYFKVSTGIAWTKADALQISWCSYFVHWCLAAARAFPLPKIGTADHLGNMGSVGRFAKSQGGVYQDYGVFLRRYAPRPGDMYHQPNPYNHIGFIWDVRDAGHGRYEIQSVDGNGGPQLSFSPLFDSSGKIGAGFIYQPPGWRKLTPDCSYIKLCDE